MPIFKVTVRTFFREKFYYHHALAVFALIVLVLSFISAALSVSASTLLADTFTGTTISTLNWTETDAGGTGGTIGNIQQSGSLSMTGSGAWGLNYLLTTSTYDRSAGGIQFDADVTCTSGSSVFGIGYGDPGVLSGGGQSYTIYAVSNAVHFSRQNANANAEDTTTGFSCVDNVPFHIKIVVGSTAGASLYIDNNGVAAATMTGGTFNNKGFFLSGHSGTATLVDNVVVTSGVSATAPDAPTALSAVPASTQMALSWTVPSNGGAAITDYLIEYKLSAAGTWSTFTDGISSTAAALVTGLTNGAPYDFRVSAVNSAGTSTASGTTTGTPNLAAPSAPQSLTATTGTSAQVGLSWSVPLTNGGASITDYLVEYKASVSSTWLLFTDGVSTATSATVTGLTNSTAYDFRVSAVNSVGTSAVSGTVSATPSFFTMLDDFTGTTIDTSKWSELDPGGAGGTTGNVQQNGHINITGTGSWGGTGLSTAATYDRTNGNTSMTVTVTRDTCGSGVGPVAIGYGDLDFTAAGTSAYILLANAGNWELYYWTNGSNVAGSGASESPQILTGFTSCTNGVPFTLTLTALQGGGASIYVNGSGTPSATITSGTFTNKPFWLSSLSASGVSDLDTVRITEPLAGPFAPTGLSAIAGNTQASLSWTSGGDNGASISDYIVQYKLASVGSWSTFADGTSATTAAVVTGLTNGAQYNFRIFAINTNGTSAASATANAKPVSSTPTAPVASAVAASGYASVGELLSGSFVYTDANADTQGATTYRWLRADTSGGTYAAISGATGSTYRLVSADLGKYIKLEVTPVATVSPTTGTPALSSALGPVSGAVPYINEIVSTGQSLSVGVGGSPALSTTQPYSNLMLTGDGGGMGAGTTFTPLIESSVETMGSAMANTITANVPGNDYTIALTNHGVSGYTYSQLKKGTGPYSTGMTQVTNVKNAAISAGKVSRVIGITAIHGETDNFNGVDGPTYEGYLEEWQSDLQNDIEAITGQSGVIPFFTDQMSSFFSSYANTPTSPEPIAQLAAAEDFPGRFVIVTPKYFFNYSDRHHLTNASYRWLGEYYGKVMKKVVVDGQAWRPLSPDSIVRNGNIIYAKFHVPAGVLTFDTTLEQAIANKGFEYYDATASASISSVSIVNADTVAITLNHTPTGSDQRLRYAYTGVAGVDAGSHSAGAAGGNLRDTDTYASLSGDTLYDWSVIFDKPISSDTSGPLVSSVASTGIGSSKTISWNTDATASSKVNYGITSSYGTSTAETDTSSGVTLHSVALQNLLACTTYHYQVVSKNFSQNQTASGDYTFTTLGCTGTATVVASSASTITATSGGTLALSGTGNTTLSLGIPSSFTATSSSVTFQASQLDDVAFFAEAGKPSGLQSLGGVYSLKALIDASTTLSTFDHPLSVTLSYDPNAMGNTDVASLTMYRYDAGTGWTALTGCSVNTGAHTVTCQTSNFSDFSIFGTQTTPSPTVTSSTGGVGVVSGPLSIGYSNAPVTTSATTTVAVASYAFTRDLAKGDSGADVLALQQYLNAHGFIIAKSGAGSPGKETTLFGAATTAAIIKFQLASGITPTSGSFGPKSRAFVSGGTTPASVASATPATFTRDLDIGSVGSDVKALQQYLNTNGYVVAQSGAGSVGKETTTFGYATRAALARFQKGRSITPATGYFGAKTRAALK